MSSCCPEQDLGDSCGSFEFLGNNEEEKLFLPHRGQDNNIPESAKCGKGDEDVIRQIQELGSSRAAESDEKSNSRKSSK